MADGLLGWINDKLGTNITDSDVSGTLATVGGLSGLAALMQNEAPEQSQVQKQSGTTSGTSTGTTSQQQLGTTAGTTETTLPQWYLDLVRQQATESTQLKTPEAFGKTLLDMPIDQYMNPYTQAVIDPVMRRQAEDQALQRQSLAAQQVSRGAFGGSRSDNLSNQMQERQALERASTEAGLRQTGFGTAQGAATNDLNRMFDEWKTMQAAPQNLASTQANILSTLKPGQITTTSGTTTGTSTGTQTGATTGTSEQTGTGVSTGTDPNKMEQLANLSGTLWGMATKK